MSKADASRARRDAPSALAPALPIGGARVSADDRTRCAQLLPAPGPNALDPAGRCGCRIDRHQSSRPRPPTWHPAGLRPGHSERVHGNARHAQHRHRRRLGGGDDPAHRAQPRARVERHETGLAGQRRRGLPRCHRPRRVGRRTTRCPVVSTVAGGRNALRFRHEPRAAPPHRHGLRRHLHPSARSQAAAGSPQCPSSCSSSLASRRSNAGARCGTSRPSAWWQRPRCGISWSRPSTTSSPSRRWARSSSSSAASSGCPSRRPAAPTASCGWSTTRRASRRWSPLSRRSPPPPSVPSWRSTARSRSASSPAAPFWPVASSSRCCAWYRPGTRSRAPWWPRRSHNRSTICRAANT